MIKQQQPELQLGRSSLLLHLITLLIMVILESGFIESCLLNDTIVVNIFEDNRVSDLSCSPHTFALSNRRGGYIRGDFSHIPKGIPILSSQLSVSLKYMFPTCNTNIKHNTSVFINDQYIMDLPLDTTQCVCGFGTFYLNEKLSYLILNPTTNTLKITTIILNNAEIYLSDFSMKFCYISQPVVDLKVESPIANIHLLTPNSYKQVQNPFFTKSFIATTDVQGDSIISNLTDYSILSIDASRLILNQTNIGKNVLVELAIGSPPSINPFLINPETGEKVLMNATFLKYRSGLLTKWIGSIPITSNLVNLINVSPITVVFFPSSNNSDAPQKLPPVSVHVFVDLDFDFVAYFNPLIVSAGVMGNLFIIGTLYMVFCYSLTIFTDLRLPFSGKLSGRIASNDASLILFPFVVTLYTPLFIFEGFSKKSYNEKITPKRVILLGGVIMIILSIIFFASLISPMAVYINHFINHSSESMLDESSNFGNATFYPCCKYSTKNRGNLSNYLKLDDERYIPCVTSSSTLYNNLTINGIPYKTNFRNYQYISSSSINYAKVNCPNSEIMIVNENVVGINYIGVAGILLGFVFLFMGLGELTFPCCKGIVKYLKKRCFNTTTTTTGSTNTNQPTTGETTTNHILPSTSTVVVASTSTATNPQAEFQRIEEELVRNQHLQIQNVELPYIPNFKQPSVSNQSIGIFRNDPNDMILESLTPQVIIYDSSIAHNPVADTEECVVFYNPNNNNNNPNNV